jgi:hypothetical protein
MHFFICTRFAQKSPSRTPRRTGQACPLSRALSTAGRLCEKKKRRTRAKPPSRQVRRGGKSYRAHHNFFASLRLCESKKKYFAREAAKTLSPPACKNFRSLILETSLPRRLGVVHNFFAPAYRRQAVTD